MILVSLWLIISTILAMATYCSCVFDGETPRKSLFIAFAIGLLWPIPATEFWLLMKFISRH